MRYHTEYIGCLGLQMNKERNEVSDAGEAHGGARVLYSGACEPMLPSTPCPLFAMWSWTVLRGLETSL